MRLPNPRRPSNREDKRKTALGSMEVPGPHRHSGMTSATTTTPTRVHPSSQGAATITASLLSHGMDSVRIATMVSSPSTRSESYDTQDSHCFSSEAVSFDSMPASDVGVNIPFTNKSPAGAAAASTDDESSSAHSDPEGAAGNDAAPSSEFHLDLLQLGFAIERLSFVSRPQAAVDETRKIQQDAAANEEDEQRREGNFSSDNVQDAYAVEQFASSRESTASYHLAVEDNGTNLDQLEDTQFGSQGRNLEQQQQQQQQVKPINPFEMLEPQSSPIDMYHSYQSCWDDPASLGSVHRRRSEGDYHPRQNGIGGGGRDQQPLSQPLLPTANPFGAHHELLHHSLSLDALPLDGESVKMSQVAMLHHSKSLDTLPLDGESVKMSMNPFESIPSPSLSQPLLPPHSSHQTLAMEQLLDSLPLQGEAVKMVTQQMPFPSSPELTQPLITTVEANNPFDLLAPPQLHPTGSFPTAISSPDDKGYKILGREHSLEGTVDALLGGSLHKLREPNDDGIGGPAIVTDDEHSVDSDDNSDANDNMIRTSYRVGPPSSSADDLCFC